jgi:hypothetical protein
LFDEVEVIARFLQQHHQPGFSPLVLFCSLLCDSQLDSQLRGSALGGSQIGVELSNAPCQLSVGLSQNTDAFSLVFRCRWCSEGINGSI